MRQKHLSRCIYLTFGISILFCVMEHSLVSGSLVEQIDTFFSKVDVFASNLLKPLMNFIKCKLAPQFLPSFYGEDKHINYLLFTRDNPRDPCDLQATDEALKKCPFDPRKETKVIVHGWTSKLPANDTKYILKDEFLQVGDYNVVVYNWTYYTQLDEISIGYIISAFFTPILGLKMSAWINFLQKKAGASPKLFHFLPHSLGSELISYAGKVTCNLGHITFLDPAGLLFESLPSFLRPAQTDADFVEAIHTDAPGDFSTGNGLLIPVGDIDYYVNGGSSQPKCHDGAVFEYTFAVFETVHSSSTRMSCNHYSVFDYYMASFNKGCKFLGLICNSYEDFQNGNCNIDNSEVSKMGFGSKHPSGLNDISKCYLRTSDEYPYCLGRSGLMPAS